MASCSQVNSLFQAYIDDELGHAEKSILECHLRECGACREEMDAQNTCVARVFESLSEHRLSWGLRSQVLAHLPEMEASIRGGSHPTDPQYARARSRGRFPWAVMAVAAVVALVSVAVYELRVAPPAAGVSGAPVGMITFRDGDGVLSKAVDVNSYDVVALKSLVREQTDYVTLGDSRLAMILTGDSTVKANYNSGFRVTNNRRVMVNHGQTYFDIGRDRDYFRVNTPDGEIVVFGTAFLIDATPSGTTVTVTEGVILVRNGHGQVAVPKGCQLQFERGLPLATPHEVDIEPLMKWANDIIPDSDALALFWRMLGADYASVSSIPAEPIYAVRGLAGHSIEKIHVNWTPDGGLGHCGYLIHVADGAGNLILLDTIDGRLFDNPEIDQTVIALPDGPISEVDVLHIRLIPDYTTGTRVIEPTIGVATE